MLSAEGKIHFPFANRSTHTSKSILALRSKVSLHQRDRKDIGGKKDKFKKIKYIKICIIAIKCF